jgi:O-antigen ligase
VAPARPALRSRVSGNERALRICELAAHATTLLLLLYFFDVLEVFVPTCRKALVPEGGACLPENAVNRAVITLSFLAACGIMLAKLPLTLGVLVRAWPLAACTGWFLASSFWANYPDLVRTRSIAVVMVYLTCVGLAVGFRSPRKLGAVFAIAAGAVLVADFLSLLAPHRSITEIGVRGIHVHKNVAGLVATVTFAILVCSVAQLRLPLARVAAIGLAVWAILFLVLAWSKSQFGIILVVIGLLPLFVVLLRRQKAGLLPWFATIAACCLIFAAGASGTKLSFFGKVFLGDPTFTNRMVIWNAVIGIILQSPWRGVGFGSFWDVGQEWNSFPADGYVYYNDASVINESHNAYLDLLLHGGVVALFLAWAVVARTLSYALALMMNGKIARPDRWAFCMMYCIIIVLLLCSILESTIFFPGGHYFYLLLIVVAHLERWKIELDAHQRVAPGRVTAPARPRRTVSGPMPAFARGGA